MKSFAKVMEWENKNPNLDLIALSDHLLLQLIFARQHAKFLKIFTNID